LQFRCRGSRRESAVAQLFSLGGRNIVERTELAGEFCFAIFPVSQRVVER